jgi:hypothetical protein
MADLERPQEKTSSPTRTRSRAPLVKAAEIVHVNAETILSTDEIIAFSILLKKNPRLSTTRRQELRMTQSAGVNSLPEQAFQAKSAEAVGFASNLTYYTGEGAESAPSKYKPANKGKLLQLRYSNDPEAISTSDKTGIVGEHLKKHAFWRAVETSSLVLPIVVLMSERRGKYGMQTNEEVSEFAEELAEISRLMAFYTDIDDPGVKQDGSVNPNYLLLR